MLVDSATKRRTIVYVVGVRTYVRRRAGFFRRKDWPGLSDDSLVVCTDQFVRPDTEDVERAPVKRTPVYTACSKAAGLLSPVLGVTFFFFLAKFRHPRSSREPQRGVVHAMTVSRMWCR